MLNSFTLFILYERFGVLWIFNFLRPKDININTAISNRNEEVELYKKWLKIEVLQMIFHNLKSILTSRNLAAGYNLTSSPSYKDFKKWASINVTLYGFWVIQGFRAKSFFVAKSTILKWFHVRYYIFWWNSPNPLVNCKQNLRNLVF